MASKRFELHLFISSVAKGTVPTLLTIPPEDDTHSFWGKEPVRPRWAAAVPARPPRAERPPVAARAQESEHKRHVELDKVQAPFSALELYSFMR
jgi:hypothetical protein